MTSQQTLLIGFIGTCIWLMYWSRNEKNQQIKEFDFDSKEYREREDAHRECLERQAEREREYSRKVIEKEQLQHRKLLERQSNLTAEKNEYLSEISDIEMQEAIIDNELEHLTQEQHILTEDLFIANENKVSADNLRFEHETLGMDIVKKVVTLEKETLALH